jgi:hypothetical protein
MFSFFVATCAERDKILKAVSHKMIVKETIWHDVVNLKTAPPPAFMLLLRHSTVLASELISP